MRSSRPTGAGTTPHLSRHGDTHLVPGAQGPATSDAGSITGEPPAPPMKCHGREQHGQHPFEKRFKDFFRTNGCFTR